MHANDQQTQRWLAQLRDGTPPQKAEARWHLSAIFSTNGMPSEAIDMLVANAREGYADAEQFQALSGLYRAMGNEYLAASAAMEAARRRQGGPVPGAAPPPPPAGGQSPFGPPPPPPQASQRTRSYAPGSAWRSTGRPSGEANRDLLGVPLTRPVLLVCWAIIVSVAVGAALVSASSPFSALLFAIAAGALALALVGPSSIRQSLRLPPGPLGDGGLVLLGLVAFLAAGALLPRLPAAQPNSGSNAATPGTIYAGTPTPNPSRPTAAPTSSPAASRTSSASGPTPAVTEGQPAPTDASGQKFMVADDPGGIFIRPGPGVIRGASYLGDGEIVTALAPDRVSEGKTWRQVVGPDQERGWVEVSQLKPAPAGPAPTFSAGVPPEGKTCKNPNSIKGNVTSTGALVYYRVGTEYYYRTYPEICFKTEDEARSAGFQPPAR